MFEKTRNGFLGIVAIGALVMLLVLIFGISRAFGADVDSGDSNQIQMNELKQRISNLEERYVAAFNSLPSEIKFCGERVPQENGYVRERLDKEAVLMVLNRKQFVLYLKRAGKYFPYIEKRLKERGMPDCLKYIFVIESALLPNALSSAGAYGSAQFMPGTASRYGLKQGLNYDERANFEKAIDAGLSYLWDNYRQFENWALAIAAYNAGEHTIEAAIKYQKTKSYYDLFLPQETMQYIYRAIVASLVMSEPKSFGLSFKDGDLYKWPEIIEEAYILSKPQLVIDLAIYFKVPVNEFLWLNPWIKAPQGKKSFKDKLRNWYLPKGTYTFKLPVNNEKH